MKQGLEYMLEGQKCIVRYQAPDRDFSDFRTEVNNDAIKIKNKYGPVYVLFSLLVVFSFKIQSPIISESDTPEMLRQKNFLFFCWV
jgi:hypothetical protein